MQYIFTDDRLDHIATDVGRILKISSIDTEIYVNQLLSLVLDIARIRVEIDPVSEDIDSLLSQEMIYSEDGEDNLVHRVCNSHSILDPMPPTLTLEQVAKLDEWVNSITDYLWMYHLGDLWARLGNDVFAPEVTLVYDPSGVIQIGK